MDFSKMSLQEMQEVLSNQSKKFSEVFNKASLLGDAEREKYLDNFTDYQIENELGLRVLTSEQKIYSYCTCYRLLIIMKDAGLFDGDLLLCSYFFPIIQRLEKLNTIIDQNNTW